jgi:hypothetical protein
MSPLESRCAADLMSAARIGQVCPLANQIAGNFMAD